MISFKGLNSLTLSGDSSSLPQVTTSILCTQRVDIVYADISELVITDIAFVSCGYGTFFFNIGSAHLERVLQASISNCIFRSGHFTVLNSNVDLLSSKFDSNSALFSVGGALAIQSSHINLSGNLFTNNNASSSHGGGVYLLDSTANISGNTFLNNSANGWGGGVYVENSRVSFNSNLFKNNTASFGGGIEVYRNSNVSATNNTFTRNTAGIGGGGIEIYDGASVNFMGNILEYNKANEGGGVSVYLSTARFASDSFISNTADETGGGILVTDGFINITESNLMSNSAGNRGGGSYLVSGTAYFHENMFVNNSASFNGAGIYSASDTNSIECTSNVFRNNRGGGWVLFIEDSRSTSALLSQNTYENNTGNAVYGSSQVTPSVYHVTPSSDSPCPNEPCLTISEFIDQAGQYIALNTTLIFLPGTHTVRSGLLVENIDSLTLLGHSSDESLPLIKCDRPASLGFKYIDELLVRALAFDSCGDGTYAAFSVKSVSSVEIYYCKFDNSIGSGGAVVVANSNKLLITKTVFENNSAIIGGGLYVSDSEVNLIENAFAVNKAELRGAGIILLGCRVNYTGMTTFRNNSVVSTGRQIVTNDREFRENSLSQTRVDLKSTGGAMFINNSDVAIRNISIENNVATYGGGLSVLGSTVSFTGLTDFVNNRAESSGGAVYAVDRSKLNFEGTGNFSSNSALNGGGLYLDHSSLCNFSTMAQLYFLQNRAKENGGAIFVADATSSVYCTENSVSENDCFFQIQPDENTGLLFGFQIHTMINFSSNIANEGGGDLYGGAIDNCILSGIEICSDYCTFQSSGDLFNMVTNGELDISSVPMSICRCENQTPNCSLLSPAIQLFPGETFNVSIAVVGQRKGVVTFPTVVQTQVSDNIKIQELQGTQKTFQSQLCSELSFTIFSSESESGNLTMYVDSPCDQNSLTIQINTQRCPHGFQLSTSTDTCICNERLTSEKFTQSCDVETSTIFRPNGSEFWVGYDIESDSLILHPRCPFDYCTEYEQFVNVDDSDTQCNYNRTGKLCGGCSGTTSLVLGSSRCMQCSNNYLALIIPFALAGIALVLFLFILKLTVAVGTINGLIFYANLVQVNSSIFYKSVNTNILTVFISWINLDLGIETCFYKGMDVYAKTWLQFVFPVYVWLLVGVIILISHFSRKVTSLLGSNPIAVLATLFLISYTKILRTIIAAFSFRYLEYPDGYTVVWAYDGNIEYFSGKHTSLFIVALLSLILLFLPFTLLLFLGQWLQMLQAKTEWRILSWINKPTFRAFLDAYHAPYASSHRYWTGLLLFVRCILFIIFATIGNASGNLFAISSAVTGLITLALAAAGIYRKHYFGILEASFFLNLVLLATATNHVQAAGGNQAAVTLISLSVAFTTFAGIVIYHIFLQIRGTKVEERVTSQVKIYSRRLTISKNCSDAELEGKEEKIESNEASITTSYVELREPLLDDY